MTTVLPLVYIWGMPIQIVDKKPSVSSTTWSRTFHEGKVSVYTSDKYQDFFKVTVDGSRPKYFFGETAWMDAQRYALDSMPNGWRYFHSVYEATV